MIPRLIRGWFWFHLLAILAVVLQPTTPALLLGRYSRTALLILAVLIIVSPLVWFGGRRLATLIEASRLTLSRRRSITLLLLCAMGLFIASYVTTGVTASYLVVSWYFDFVLITLGVWALQALSGPGGRWITNFGLALGLGTCLFVLAIGVHYPGMQWNDTGFDFVASIGVLREGRPVLVFMEPLIHYEHSTLFYYGQAGWLSLFGVSVEIARLYTLVLALMGCVFIYLAAARAFSRSAAWIAVILSAIAFLNDNYLRFDTEAAVLIALALLCFVHAQRKGKLWLHFATGLAIAFSLDGHPNTYRFVIGFGVAYLLEYALLLHQRWQTGQRKVVMYWPLVALVIGGVVGLAIYIRLWTVLTPQTFGQAVQSPFFAVALADMPGLLFTQFYVALTYGTLLFGAAILGAGLSLRHSAPVERLAAVALLTGALIVALAYGYYRTYYFTQCVPLLAMLAAGLFFRLEQALDADKRKLVISGVTALVLVASLGSLVNRIRSDQPYEQSLIIADQLRKVVPIDAVLVGPDPLYPRMTDYLHFTDLNVYGFVQSQYKLDGVAVWDKVAPTAVTLASDYPVQIPSLTEFVNQQHFVRVRCWTSSQMGRVELFMQAVPTGVTPINDCQPIG